MVAGEPSGDLLGAGLVRALRQLCPDAQMRGVGGEAMATAGIPSLFPIADLAVMGLFEVLPRLPRILKRRRQTVADIATWRPDVIVTIDSWGFVSSLIPALRRAGVAAPVVHYVAPQVWAWKRGRAKSVAKKVSRLMTLLPDEGKFFEPHGLRCDFVGHPVVERMAAASLDGAGLRARLGITASQTVVTVLPGSRRGEVRKLLPVLLDAAAELGNVEVLIPVVAALADEVRRISAGYDLKIHVIEGEAARYDAFAASDVALSKSGTVSLELAAVGVPHLIAYTFNSLTNRVARMLVKIPFANLINILSEREVIPEFVLEKCRPELIASCARELLSSPEAVAKQRTDAAAALALLRLPTILPSMRAAQIVLEEATKSQKI